MCFSLLYGFEIWALGTSREKRHLLNWNASKGEPLQSQTLIRCYLKACAQRFRYALFAFIHTQTYFEYYTLTLRLASLVKKAVIYAYCTKELFDICRENVSHMATLHSVAKHVIHADNLGPRH